MVSLFLFSLLLGTSAGALVVQSHWSHVRLKSIPPARVDGREGGEVILYCSATGSPAPHIAWYKDSMFVSHLDWRVEEEISSMGESVARLIIPCLSQSDVGKYECRARSGEHEVSATTELNVVPNDDPKAGHCSESGLPQISMWRRTYMAEEGDTAVLPCRVQNDASDYKFTWSNADGGNPGAGNDVRYSLLENGDLVIRETRFSDMGQYTCTVTGPAGSDTVHTFFYPLAPERNMINK
ncbi:neural/ectodermal development factor IMP-L2 [Eurytemora carolleeae]|uniref:neural/ectodermal development factor IMP-L2 n=1 Tax=Eurytemora carolleeae TaxID=1294199 RepID=UPI000C774D63|nr:neural/ectodermal development factor IMP-L2 [Eurytemora carolleeae]|eukprot:XP_023331344.1 neural/ectodermal development factor IMP-L2-like [Eurytemora affinis]